MLTPDKLFELIKVTDQVLTWRYPRWGCWGRWGRRCGGRWTRQQAGSRTTRSGPGPGSSSFLSPPLHVWLNQWSAGVQSQWTRTMTCWLLAKFISPYYQRNKSSFSTTTGKSISKMNRNSQHTMKRDLRLIIRKFQLNLLSLKKHC